MKRLDPATITVKGVRCDPRPECVCGGTAKICNMACHECSCRWDRLHCSKCGVRMEPVTVVDCSRVAPPRVCEECV